MRISDWSSDVCSSDLPRLAAGMEWPRIDDQPADFLAQIDCTALPPDLWGGLGPREGALAFFLHRRRPEVRSEEHTSELQSLMRISYAVFCLKKKTYKRQLLKQL